MSISDIINQGANVAYLSILGDESTPPVKKNTTAAESIVALKTQFPTLVDREMSLSSRILFTKNIDLTSYVNNASITRKKVSREAVRAPVVSVVSVPIQGTTEANLDLVDTNMNRSGVNPDDSVSGYNRKLNREMLRQHGIPCTALGSVKPSYTPSGLSLRGIGQRGTTGVVDLQLLSTSLCGSDTPSIGPQSVGMLKQTTSETAHIVEELVIPSWMDADKYTILVEIVDSRSSRVIDSVQLPLNISDVISDARRLEHDPVVSMKTSRASTSFWCSSDDGDRVGSYRLIKKQYDPRTGGWSWNVLGTYPAVNGTSRINILSQVGDPGTFRIIAVDRNGGTTQRFVDVQSSDRRSTKYAIASVSKIVESGIQHTVRNIPPGASSVSFYIKDLCKVGDEYQLVATRAISPGISWIHSENLVEDHTYSLRCGVRTLQGNIEIFSRESIIKWVPLRNNIISTRIENFAITNSAGGSSDVTFTVSTTLIDGNNDALLSLLNKSGITRYYDNDIQTARNKLKDLLRSYVVRHNLSTGDVEDLGAITSETGEFVDSAASSLCGASQIDPQQHYTYEIRTYVRNPDTLLDDYVKTSTDVKSGRSYRWSPAKFLHPAVLARGVITSTVGEKENYGLDKFKFFDSGSVSYVDLTPLYSAPTITTPSAKVVRNGLVSISWSTVGSLQSLDHYVILIQQGSATNILGVAHHIPVNGTSVDLQFDITGYVGSHRFLIVPVLLDGSETTISTTNYVDIT